MRVFLLQEKVLHLFFLQFITLDLIITQESTVHQLGR